MNIQLHPQLIAYSYILDDRSLVTLTESVVYGTEENLPYLKCSKHVQCYAEAENVDI